MASDSDVSWAKIYRINIDLLNPLRREAQTQASRSISQLLLQGCEMSRMLQPTRRLCCGLRKLPDRSAPADWRACKAHRGPLFPTKRRSSLSVRFSSFLLVNL
uniref:Uncharacterized protein n=1 Tax=Musa acuminata subsp. malaccensis TaxID=214687 RepID=A0A804KVF6_MUSAM